MKIKKAISVLSKVPSSRWAVHYFNTFDGKCCALGHLRKYLNNLTYPIPYKPNVYLELGEDIAHNLMQANDDVSQTQFKGKTAKARTLRYLKSLEEANG